MADAGYTMERTALLFVDPYNDFLSHGGKLGPFVKRSRTRSGTARQPVDDHAHSSRPESGSPSVRSGAGGNG